MTEGAVSQERLLEQLLPLLRTGGPVFRKHRCVMAREAVIGEVVVSTTSAGVETVNTAREGDYVVMNLTQARETYIVRGSTFRERYELDQALDEWSRYRPLGRVIALEVSEPLLTLLQVQSPFYIEASWQALQTAMVGDYLACPLDLREIYRIGREEFDETYVAEGAHPLDISEGG
jgi:hypothetical protein